MEDDISKLIGKAIRSTPSAKFQEVKPVKIKDNIVEVQFSFYIEKNILKKLKTKAIENETSVKFLINDLHIRLASSCCNTCYD